MFLIKLILIVVAWGFIRRLLRGISRKSQGNKTRFDSNRSTSSSSPNNNPGGPEAEDPFKKITQQDIDDADFEEIP